MYALGYKSMVSRDVTGRLDEFQFTNLPFKTGRWYGAYGAGPRYGVGGVAFTEDRIYFVPVFVTKGEAIASMGVDCVNIVGTCGIRMGIWDDSGGLPLNCLVDTGNLVINSAGWKEIDESTPWVRGSTSPFSYTGWYWFGFQWSTNTGSGLQFRAHDQNTCYNQSMLGIVDPPTTTAEPAVHVYIAGASSGDTTTAFGDQVDQSTITYETGTRAPRILVQGG